MLSHWIRLIGAFNSLSIQVQQKMGSLEPAAAKALVGIEGAKGKERASVLYTAAELLIRSGDDEQAYELFTQVTELDEDHVGAKRRLRLRDMRNKFQGQVASHASGQ